MENTAAVRGPPSTETTGAKGPKSPDRRDKKSQAWRDPETHLSVDDSSSSSTLSSSSSLSLSSSSLLSRSPALEALTTAPSGCIGGGPLPAGLSSTTAWGPQLEETKCRLDPPCQS
jgi:hypothetical protein